MNVRTFSQNPCKLGKSHHISVMYSAVRLLASVWCILQSDFWHRYGAYGSQTSGIGMGHTAVRLLASAWGILQSDFWHQYDVQCS